MSGDSFNTIMIAASGMRAQSQRIQVIAQNLANAESTASTPGQDPYRRQIPTFQNELDRELGVRRVRMGEAVQDTSEFGSRYDPNHPAADEAGYVQTPNVNALIEMMDMRQAQRSYEANLNMISTARSMMMRTLDLLRA